MTGDAYLGGIMDGWMMDGSFTHCDRPLRHVHCSLPVSFLVARSVSCMVLAARVCATRVRLALASSYAKQQAHAHVIGTQLSVACHTGCNHLSTQQTCPQQQFQQNGA
jgi:hypothetical protein